MKEGRKTKRKEGRNKGTTTVTGTPSVRPTHDTEYLGKEREGRDSLIQ
jgi:hypothetical protein